MKTKRLLKALIQHHKIWMEHSERHYGYGSPQHEEAKEAFWEAQKELGAIELAEFAEQPAANKRHN